MPDEGRHILKASDLMYRPASGSAAVPGRDGARCGARLGTTLRRGRGAKEKAPQGGLKAFNPAKWGANGRGLEVHSTPCGEKGSRLN